MTPRERVMTAMNRRKPDKVPKQAGFTPALFDVFKEKTGSSDPAEYFGFETRNVGAADPREKPDFSRYFKDLPPGAGSNEWGMTSVRGTFYHFRSRLYPLENATQLAEFETYPWPDLLEPYRYEGMADRAKSIHHAGFYSIGCVGHIFEIAWQIRRMDMLFLDFFERPELAEFLLDRITERQAEVARQVALADSDQLLLGDDVGMQDRMMMSPDCWRQWFKPRLGKVIASAKAVKPDIQVWYHSDGTIQPIIEDLIEVGVTILNPVQPECMDPAWVKKEYGDRLAFWGTIGTQTTMPFGTVEDVRQEVRKRIETVGYDGGLLLAPTHVLEPDVPWENVVALFDAIDEFGTY